MARTHLLIYCKHKAFFWKRKIVHKMQKKLKKYAPVFLRCLRSFFKNHIIFWFCVFSRDIYKIILLFLSLVKTIFEKTGWLLLKYLVYIDDWSDQLVFIWTLYFWTMFIVHCCGIWNGCFLYDPTTQSIVQEGIHQVVEVLDNPILEYTSKSERLPDSWRLEQYKRIYDRYYEDQDYLDNDQSFDKDFDPVSRRRNLKPYCLVDNFYRKLYIYFPYSAFKAARSTAESYLRWLNNED